jgi:hypothetical protein
MRQLLAVDLLPEVLVVGDQNPVLCKGSLDHLIVIRASCFFIDGEDIVL